MNLKNVTVALPTKDLRQAFLFYRDGLGLNTPRLSRAPVA